jgi:hypothetical protein
METRRRTKKMVVAVPHLRPQAVEASGTLVDTDATDIVV